MLIRHMHFFKAFRNINTVVDSASQVNTIPIDQTATFLPFDYNLLARKVIASDEFQRLIINQLNISQSDLLKFQEKELQQLLKIQFQQMNSENLNWINVNIFHKYLIILIIFCFCNILSDTFTLKNI